MIRLSDEFVPAGKPLFSPGQLVRHRRYGYRGVVVAWDPECRANEAWYQANKTQPDRNQPWYHVLVHDTEQVTYPAESSLEADPSGDPVQHPMLNLFFAGFRNGHHIRNDNPWPQPGA